MGVAVIKGGIENANNSPRVHFPRSIDIRLVSQNKIDILARNINNRPIKCHGYRTAAEIFSRVIRIIKGYNKPKN